MFKHAETRRSLHTHTHTHTHTHGCLCKIIIPTILTISITSPSYSDISKETMNATCDNTTLGTTSGESTLSAQWTANEINLKWYNGETEFATNTCTYDGGITLPASAPQRVGYNFAGWQVLFDLSTLADKIDINGYILASRNANSDNCYHVNENTGDTVASKTCTESIFADYNANEWRVGFEYGTVKGIARCSTTPGGVLETGNPADSGGGQYCWCQATGYATSGSNSFANVSSPSWVFYDDRDYAGLCAYGCAGLCAYGVWDDSGFRSAVFGLEIEYEEPEFD